MEGIWPLVILWILFSVIGSRKKKPPAAGGGQSAVGSGPVSLPDTFRQALEELKRAEREATGQAQLELKPQAKQEYKPRQYAPKPVAKAVKKKRTPEPADAESDESSERVFTPEGKADFDDEAEAIAARRREAVEGRGVRESKSIRELTPEQLARRGARPEVAIGGQAEHDAWHMQMVASGSAQAHKRTSGQKHPVLGRYADGTTKGAIILAEILGRPKAS